jgi:hypothetical protein
LWIDSPNADEKQEADADQETSRHFCLEGAQ